MNLWENSQWVDWYNSRPDAIKEAIQGWPPDVAYKVHGGLFPAFIHSYDLEQDGSVTMKMDIQSLLLPRRVFGVKGADLERFAL